MDQTTALNLMQSGRNIFLTGQAGSGKTFVLNSYIQRLRDCGVSVAVTASTGIAATHIGGSTIHSRSGIGIKEDLSERDVDDIAGKSWVRKHITHTHVLIIDEVSMLSAQTLDNIERIIQAVTYDDRPRGGMQVIFCGDFFQLPPITKWGDTTKRFAFAAQAWNDADLTFCYLDTQYRQDDDVFTNLLSSLRVGQMSDETLALLASRKDAVLKNPSPVRLFTHNVDVDRINNEHLLALPGDIMTYTATTKGNKKVVQGLLRGMLTPEILQLKVDAQVLFVKNNPAMGYWNGTTGVVIGFDTASGYPRVRIQDGTIITVEPEERSIETEDALLGKVTQIPLKLARAITIHKSQGMTLDAAEIDLSKSFAYGQSYVALSRVRSLDGLRLLGLNKQGLQAHPLVLRGDIYFQEQSAHALQTVADMSPQDWSSLHASFIHTAGGEYRSPEELQGRQRTSKQLASKKKKVDTVQLTAELVEQGKTLDELMELRGYTRATILKHIGKIRALYPDIDMQYLQPPQNLLDRVQGVVDEVVQDDSNWTETGVLRLAAVYRALGGKVGYDDLKRCMPFVERGVGPA